MPNTPPNSSSRTRRNQIYLFGGIAAMIAVIVAIALVGLLFLRREAENRVKTTTENLATSLTLTVDGVIDTLDIALIESMEEYSRELAAGGVGQKEFSKFLTGPQKYLPLAPYVRATNERGDIVYGLTARGEEIHPPYINVADRDYFVQQRDNPNLGLVVGIPVFSRANKEWIWPISRRLNRPDGSFAGVVYGSIHVEQLQRILAQLKLEKGETIGLRHADMQLIAGRDEATASFPIPIGDSVVSTPFRESLKRNPMGGIYFSDSTKIDQVSRVFSYQRSQKYGFLVNVGNTGKAVYSEWHKQVWITGIFIVAFVLTSAAFAILVRRSWLLQERDLSALNEAHELANLGNFEIDLDSRRIDVSPSVRRIMGIGPEFALTVESWLQLVGESMRDDALASINDRIVSKRPFEYEYRLVRASDQQERWLHSRGMVRCSANGTPIAIAGTVQDITERKLAEDEIKNLAYFDLLTGLPNRRLLHDRLTHALATCNRNKAHGALLILDLDNFKSLNDTSGHHVGDELLKAVASRLLECVREADTVARLGGDEFVVVLEGLSRDQPDAICQVEAVAQKILEALNRSFQLPGNEHHSTPSIGVTLFSGDRQTPEEVMKRADAAMYQAKAAGRNTMRFFDPSMQRAIENQMQVESDLRAAIGQSQFTLHYQPQVDADNNVVGAEALIRWPHPERGMVSPANFIPVAEKSGLILPIGDWVLQQACAQLAKWAERPETAHMVLSVNVSVRQFAQPNFIEEVLAVLDRSGACAERLKLELTEGMLLENAEEVIGKMTALKARGVSFSLDDFGTGYSSLSYLKRLPLDQLKIDQSFVRDVLSDPNDAAIARTVVALGKSLGLEVIAEGVETAPQRDFLLRAGCRVYQGYFFSKPLPVEQFEAFLVQRPSVLPV